MCSEWRGNAIQFFYWAEKSGHKIGLQIDRRDSDGDYSPKNCRWITNTDNQRNRRDCYFWNFNDLAFPSAQALGDHLGISKQLVRFRTASPNFHNFTKTQKYPNYVRKKYVQTVFKQKYEWLYKDKVFRTMSEMASHLGLSKGAIEWRVRNLDFPEYSKRLIIKI